MPNDVVWQPLPGSQTFALNCPAHVILYHGTRGPGKTDAQLMRYRAQVGVGFGRHWRGIIFDREYKNLDDLISKSMRWFPEFDDGAKFKSSKSDYKWVWPTGEELLFRAIKKESDYWNYHGQEFSFIGVNEATKFANSDIIDMMMSCNRSSYVPDWDDPDCPGEIPLELFLTCNPHGVGHNWVKKRYINAGRSGQIVKNSVRVFNPRTQREEDIVKTQVHIFGSYRENKFLSPEYVAELSSITDKNKRRAWLAGDWDIVAGGMFDDVWDSDQHIIRAFDIPPSWKIDRSFDWGSSRPFSVGWWAESDGSDVRLPNGKTISTVRGDLFRIAEWYGFTGKPNQGLGLLASEISAGIIERELAMGIYGKVKPGPADNSIWDVQNGNSIAADMSKPVRIGGKVYKGLGWARSDKSPGSRKAGWQQLKKRLKNSLKPEHGGPREHPGLFIFDDCKHFIDLVPVLPRDEKDPDDVDTDAEDHIADESRYRVLASNMGAKSGKAKGLT